MAGTTDTRTPRLRFHAVAVMAGPNACATAARLKGVRLLSAEAPKLPMADCDRQDQCNCRFRHYDDRRAGPRRRVESTGAGAAWTQAERRAKRGRRESDFVD
jgi:hypothetical protein